MKQAIVHCRRSDGGLIRSYDLGYETTLGSVPPDRRRLIDEAKTNLTNERLAFPPYADITFDVRYP